MTRINKITLIKEVESTDSIGQPVTSESTTDLIAEIQNVTQSEFMQGQQDGLSPAYVFRISIFGYSGERLIEYMDHRYTVYRTYQADENYIELYTELEVGSNTEPDDESEADNG
ncbi:MAG: phage head closure protein [Bacteroidales bacterium]|nr:phage head closure protein [Bacteroidales bacterium]